jgi:hypothetical protein
MRSPTNNENPRSLLPKLALRRLSWIGRVLWCLGAVEITFKHIELAWGGRKFIHYSVRVRRWHPLNWLIPVVASPIRAIFSQESAWYYFYEYFEERNIEDQIANRSAD